MHLLPLLRTVLLHQHLLVLLVLLLHGDQILPIFRLALLIPGLPSTLGVEHDGLVALGQALLLRALLAMVRVIFGESGHLPTTRRVGRLVMLQICIDGTGSSIRGAVHIEVAVCGGS